MIILFIVFIIIGYLFGSLSSGVIVCKLMGLPDPRTQESGSTGATNVLRVGGKQAAALVLLFDILKGFIPVFLAGLLGLSNMSLAFVGLAAVLGHIFPVFFGFKGGKGVATAVGVWLGLSFGFGLLMAIIWVGIAFLSRYSSVASLCVAFIAPILGPFLTNNISYFIPLGLISLFIIWRHLDNIGRIKAGTESKINLGT